MIKVCWKGKNSEYELTALKFFLSRFLKCSLLQPLSTNEAQNTVGPPCLWVLHL